MNPDSDIYSYCLNNPLKYTDPSGNYPRELGPHPTPVFSGTDYMSYNNREYNWGSGGGLGLFYSNTPHIAGWKAGEYSYDSSSGKYTNGLGQEVDYTTAVYGSVANSPGSSLANISFLVFTGTRSNPYQTFRGVIYGNGSSWYSGDPLPSMGGNSSNGYESYLKSTLNICNDGLNAIGMFAGSSELFTRANAEARIMYTTLKGSTAWISSADIISTFNAVGKYTYYGSLVFDATLGITGNQNPWNTIRNMGVGTFSYALGGPLGIVLGIGYTALDKTGMLDTPSIPVRRESYPYVAIPDATRIAQPFIQNH